MSAAFTIGVPLTILVDEHGGVTFEVDLSDVDLTDDLMVEDVDPIHTDQVEAAVERLGFSHTFNA